MKITVKPHSLKRVMCTSVLGMLLGFSAHAANGIVAIVGHQVITQQELGQRELQVRAQSAGQNLPHDLTRQVLEGLVTERALLQAAMDMGIHINPGDVDQAQQRIAAQNGLSVTQLLQRVQQEGLSEAGYRQQLHDQLLVQQARERVLEQRLKITTADIQSMLRDANQAQGPERIELAQVLISVPENATAKERTWRESWAASVAQRAQQGADFGRLVQTYSSDHSTANGSLGFKESTAYPDLFLKAVEGVPVGGVSSVVSSGAGFHVIKVLRREAAPSALRVTQTHVRHILRMAQSTQQRQTAAQQLSDLRVDILAGKTSFEAAAKQWGEDGTSAHGGDLGWAQPGQFVLAFEAAMNALQPGVVSQPVETNFGLHLIEVLGRRQVEMSDAQQRAWAEAKLRQDKGAAILEAWTREVRAGAYVQIQDPELR